MIAPADALRPEPPPWGPRRTSTYPTSNSFGRLDRWGVQGDVVLVDRHGTGCVGVEVAQADAPDEECRRGRTCGANFDVRGKCCEIADVLSAQCLDVCRIKLSDGFGDLGFKGRDGASLHGQDLETRRGRRGRLRGLVLQLSLYTLVRLLRGRARRRSLRFLGARRLGHDPGQGQYQKKAPCAGSPVRMQRAGVIRCELIHSERWTCTRCSKGRQHECFGG